MREAGRERRARAVLGVLLRLYPASFRQVVGEDLLETVLYRWREVACTRPGALRFWVTEGWRFAWDGVLERARGVRGLGDDARGALRQPVRSPGFVGLAVVTLGLGIGAATTMFAVTDAVVFRSLRYERADELYLIHARLGDLELSSTSLPNLRDVQTSVTAFAWLAGARDDSPALGFDDGAAERVSILEVTEGYHSGLGGDVQLGRSFAASDYGVGAERVALLSASLWQRRWGGDRGVLGQAIRLNGALHTVVGVMQASFRDPEPIESGVPTSVWLPVREDDPDALDRGEWSFRMLGRLAPGVGRQVAAAQLSATAAALVEAHPQPNTLRGRKLDFVMRSLHDQTVGEAGNRLLLVFGAVSLLLLLSCVNVAGLFLARGNTRRTELGVRSALGATRGRLVRLLLFEALVTATLAGALGVVLGFAGLRVFLLLAPEGIPRLHEVGMDARVLAFVIGLITVTSLAFGLFPALRGGRQAALTASARLSPARSFTRTQSILLGAEVALSLLLLAGSALLLNSLIRLVRVDPGFDDQDVVLVDVRPPHSARTSGQRAAFYETLIDAVASLPGVATVAAAHSAPGSRGGFWTSVKAEESAAVIGDQELFRLNPIVGDFFDVLDVPLRAGTGHSEWFDQGDAAVVVLNDAAVRRFFPGAELALGRRLAVGSGPDASVREVVGIVADVRQRGLASEPEPQIYVPYLQDPTPRLTLLLELEPGAAVPASAIRDVVAATAPGVPVDGIRTLREQVSATAAQPRFLAFMFSVFAVIGLVLAAIGTYATASYTVSRRMRELGIRRALGARSIQIFSAMFARAMGAAAVGLATGVVAFAAFSRFLQAYVYAISPRDPVTIFAACLLIAGTVAVATIGPALRAARSDPNAVLRTD